ncbi:hypothetical protein EV363DRAFT_885151 [Boletus edulis]|nr:hypothetical protein EV363DRAFT_885151 [Boletus edulis]
MCTVVKPRIRVLATKRDGLVGHLAAEILLVLYDPDGQNQLDIHDTRARANLASALVRLNLEKHGSADDEGSSVDPRQQILRRLFGLDAEELSDLQKELIGALKKAVEKCNARERTVATMTLLKLCESESIINELLTWAHASPATIIRAQLREIKLLDVFINQLQQKDDALLGAYALVTCLKYSDMKESIKDNEDWPKHIIDMLDKGLFRRCCRCHRRIPDSRRFHARR